MKFETSSGGGFMSYHHPFDIGGIFLPIAKKCEANGQVMVMDIGSPGHGELPAGGGPKDRQRVSGS